MASEPLPSYDKDAVCPKCEHDTVTTRFCNGPWYRCHDSGFGDKGHLHRTCTKCGYNWLEAPSDGN